MLFVLEGTLRMFIPNLKRKFLPLIPKELKVFILTAQDMKIDLFWFPEKQERKKRIKKSLLITFENIF